MLKKRLIFTLLYDDGFFVLSRNFHRQRVGDIAWLEKNYNFSNIAKYIDELVVLDISNRERDIERFQNVLKKLCRFCFIPLAAGGGVSCMADAARLFDAGADKIVVNSGLFVDSEIVDKMASVFGQQAIVGSVDVKSDAAGRKKIRYRNGSLPAPVDLVNLHQYPSIQSIGEIYLNSMDQDGTGQGLDLSLVDALGADFGKPIILAGGVGNASHLRVGLENKHVDAVATANLFNFIGDGFVKARRSLIDSGLPLPIGIFDDDELEG